VLPVCPMPVEHEATRRDPSLGLGYYRGPGLECGCEAAYDFVRRDQPERIPDRTVDPDLQRLPGLSRVSASLEATEVRNLRDFHVIVAVCIHRVRASWRAVRR
jgi:hypothetical protein